MKPRIKVFIICILCSLCLLSLFAGCKLGYDKDSVSCTVRTTTLGDASITVSMTVNGAERNELYVLKYTLHGYDENGKEVYNEKITFYFLQTGNGDYNYSKAFTADGAVVTAKADRVRVRRNNYDVAIGCVIGIPVSAAAIVMIVLFVRDALGKDKK